MDIAQNYLRQGNTQAARNSCDRWNARRRKRPSILAVTPS
jgi:hypothetical protein